MSKNSMGWGWVFGLAAGCNDPPPIDPLPMIDASRAKPGAIGAALAANQIRRVYEECIEIVAPGHRLPESAMDLRGPRSSDTACQAMSKNTLSYLRLIAGGSLGGIIIAVLLAGCGTTPPSKAIVEEDSEVEEARGDLEDSKADYEECLRDQDKYRDMDCGPFKEMYQEDRGAYEQLLKQKREGR